MTGNHHPHSHPLVHSGRARTEKYHRPVCSSYFKLGSILWCLTLFNYVRTYHSTRFKNGQQHHSSKKKKKRSSGKMQGGKKKFFESHHKIGLMSPFQWIQTERSFYSRWLEPDVVKEARTSAEWMEIDLCNSLDTHTRTFPKVFGLFLIWRCAAYIVINQGFPELTAWFILVTPPLLARCGIETPSHWAFWIFQCDKASAQVDGEGDTSVVPFSQTQSTM